ncbi:DUF2254 family protein [Methanolobus bombayensis]|uniref:DUF2254 family protein n=1 Tax=Methanolobus bombayensis TaxID=38023 RepID=UPI001AE78957|nr:DUF2254 family protein [Methanolobus bombayensis]
MLSNKLKEKCNNLANYFDKPAWINRTLFYATIFASITLAFIIVFGIFNLTFPNFTFPNNAIDYDNERYLLSALVQSLAATIALVITLSLVAVQLAAQSYSARVIDVYKRNPDMWILLCIYIFTIFYGLGLTKIIGLGILGNYMEGAIFVAYFMGFFAFVCLVPYMLKTLDLLKPSTVIKLLAEEITKEKILEALENDGDIVEKDPMQSIVDMVNRAILYDDYETAKNGINAIKKSITCIIKSNHFNEHEEKKMSFYMFQHVQRLGIHSINKKNEESTNSIIICLEELGHEAVKQNRRWILKDAVTALGIIGVKAAEEELKITIEKAEKTLGKIGVHASEKRLHTGSINAIRELGKVGTIAVEKKLYWIEVIAVDEIKKVGVKAEEEKLVEAAIEAAKKLKNIGVKAIDKEREGVVSTVSKALDEIRNIAIKNGKSQVAEECERGFNILKRNIEEMWEMQDRAIKRKDHIKKFKWRKITKQIDEVLHVVKDTEEDDHET